MFFKNQREKANLFNQHADVNVRLERYLSLNIVLKFFFSLMAKDQGKTTTSDSHNGCVCVCVELEGEKISSLFSFLVVKCFFSLPRERERAAERAEN